MNKRKRLALNSLILLTILSTAIIVGAGRIPPQACDTLAENLPPIRDLIYRFFNRRDGLCAP
ncbi:MAG: hypothetical protein OEY49_09755 [Candidatus Heimdallarchaeota archaeon]|nr:hypothetical protein [Candidatus Heimdallarchaeota archaeon]